MAGGPQAGLNDPPQLLHPFHISRPPDQRTTLRANDRFQTTKNQTTFQALLDFGSDKSYVHPQFVQNFQLSLQPFQEDVVTVNGSITRIQNKVQFPIRYNKDSYDIPVTCRVLPDLPYPALFGRDILHLLPITVKMDGQLMFRGFQLTGLPPTTPTSKAGQGLKFAGGTNDEQEQLRKMLMKYQDGVFEWSGRQGLLVEHVASLPLHDMEPVNLATYRVGPQQREIFQQVINDYLQKGFIEPSTSQYSSPAFLIGRKGTTDQPTRYRLVQDYRELNK